MGKSSQDIAVLSQNKPAGLEGVPGIVQFYQAGTPELKALLQSECDIIFECRYCRAMFRSVINFITHKRQYCKGKFGAVVANSATLWEQYMETIRKVESDPDNAEDGEGKSREKNLVRILNRKNQDVTVPIPGSSENLIISTLPRICTEVPADQRIVGLAAAGVTKAIADSRMPVYFPQDPNFRNKAAKARRDTVLGKYSNELPPSELAALHKILRFNAELVDGMTIKCTHPSCSDVKAFKNFCVFGYHCGMKHFKRQEDGKITCYLCNHGIKQLSNYHNHYAKVHKAIKDEHDQDRKDDPNFMSKKYHRNRSLSPADKIEDQEEDNNLTCSESSPPLIVPIDINDSGLDCYGENDDDTPPTLTRMSRIRTRPCRDGDNQSTPMKMSKIAALPMTPSNTSSENLEFAELQDILDKKLAREVKAVVNKMLTKVEENLGEKPDLSQIKLIGKKKRLRGRAAYMEKQRLLANRVARQLSVKSKSPEEVVEETEYTPQPEEDEPKMKKRRSQSSAPVEESPRDSAQDSVDVSGPRGSRAKKRPGWMETELYHLDAAKKKEETQSSKSPLPPTTVKTPVSTSVGQKSKSATYKSSTKKIKSLHVKRASQRQLSLKGDDQKEFVLPVSSANTGPAENEDEPKTPVLSSPSRRKQDMSVVCDTNDETLLHSSQYGKSIPNDLAMIPVYLSGMQKAIIFAGLKPNSNPTSYNPANDSQQEGGYYCEYCPFTHDLLKEGRRHMVSHVRVHRLKCKLCHAGAFFVTDLRAHLQERCCPNLDKAGFPLRDESPYMTKAEADSLIEVVDLDSPGRVKYTSGKIVSVVSKEPYIPDLEIEEKILGPYRGRNFLMGSPASRKI